MLVAFSTRLFDFRWPAGFSVQLKMVERRALRADVRWLLLITYRWPATSYCRPMFRIVDRCELARFCSRAFLHLAELLYACSVSQVIGPSSLMPFATC